MFKVKYNDTLYAVKADDEKSAIQKVIEYRQKQDDEKSTDSEDENGSSCTFV